MGKRQGLGNINPRHKEDDPGLRKSVFWHLATSPGRRTV